MSCYCDNEHMQYALIDLGNKKMIIDAEECTILQDNILDLPYNNKKEMKEQLVYGNLIAQDYVNLEYVCKKMKFYKNDPFLHVNNSECFISYIEEIQFYPEFKENQKIPFACLIKSPLDFSEPKNEYHFSYTLFKQNKRIRLAENLLRREFILSIKDREPHFKPGQNWLECINQDLLFELTKEFL